MIQDFAVLRRDESGTRSTRRLDREHHLCRSAGAAAPGRRPGPGASSARPRPSTPSAAQACLARVGPRSAPPCFFEPPTIVGAIRSGPPGPAGGARPAPRGHQVAQRLRPRSAAATVGRRRGPAEPGRVRLRSATSTVRGRSCGHAEVRRVQQPPPGHVAQLPQPVQRRAAGRRGTGSVLSPLTFSSSSARGRIDLAQLHGPGVQVTLVGGAELPARHGERRAGHAARHQGHAPRSRCGRHSAGSATSPSATFQRGPVGPQRGARRRVELDRQRVLEAARSSPRACPPAPAQISTTSRSATPASPGRRCRTLEEPHPGQQVLIDP